MNCQFSEMCAQRLSGLVTLAKEMTVTHFLRHLLFHLLQYVNDQIPAPVTRTSIELLSVAQDRLQKLMAK